MEWVVVLVFVIALIAVGLWVNRTSRLRAARALADAREDALRWYERLGGQVLNLHGDEPAARQALADASERYTAAGAQLDRSTTVRQFELARETALEGLAYVRAARVALGLDPGPEIPPLAGQRAAGAITKDREVEVEGHSYRASPQPGSGTPYYYPGGRIHGRGVPAGWYSDPWWKTALVAGAWGLGSMMVFSALFSPAWGDSGYDAGYQDGVENADQGMDGGGGGDYAGGDFSGGSADFGGGGDFG